VADIFLSYSRADRPKAQQIAKALEQEGFTVWWDKILRAGQTYDEVTEGMLRDARVVIVLWSEVSVKSKWVRAEATLGERTSTVIPAMIQDAERPIMFELTQSADLIGWDGDREDSHWKGFVADIRLALERSEAKTDAAPAAVEPSVAPQDATIENTFWTSIADSDDPADYEAYLSRYPDGHFVDLARNRLAGLAKVASPSAGQTPAPAAQPPLHRLNLPRRLRQSPTGLSRRHRLGRPGAGRRRCGDGDVRPEARAAARSRRTGRRPLAAFADCDTCPAMIPIPAGSFQMGSPATEAGRTGNEDPLHEVTLPSFAIGQTEITFDEWDACVAGGGCNGFEPSDRGYGKGRQPVIGVSWSDANAYARWLSSKTGRTYRLPTEAEWEYAARGGTTTAYWWGDYFDAAIAPSRAPVPVDTLAENPFGLKGMLGNAREWVEDCYINNYVTRRQTARPNGTAIVHVGYCGAAHGDATRTITGPQTGHASTATCATRSSASA
jgi:formylglycine-generating enzyme required for sulfatase activity